MMPVILFQELAWVVELRGRLFAVFDGKGAPHRCELLEPHQRPPRDRTQQLSVPHAQRGEGPRRVGQTLRIEVLDVLRGVIAKRQES